MPERIYNSHYSNGVPAMFSKHCLPLSVVELKGDHCQKPHCRNGVVDTLGLYVVQNTQHGNFNLQIIT